MGDIVVVRYRDHESEPANFLKELALVRPNLTSTQRLLIYCSRNAPEYATYGNFFATGSPNIEVCYEEDEDIEKLKTRKKPGDIMTQTKEVLLSNDIRNPFDCGMILPNDVVIDLEADLGLDEAKLSNFENCAISWDFNAHEYSPDELLGIVYILFKRLLSQEDLPEEIRISDQELIWFLAICRALYNPHVPYHSYWHSVDVTQLTFALTDVDPRTWDLDPARRLALVLAALGHDMKHPGLVHPVIETVDREFGERWESLEAYHLEIFENVLDQLWPSMKKRWSAVIGDAIKATEMAKHYKYMKEADDEDLSYVHAIKISDFAGSLRVPTIIGDTTACLVFTEFYNQALLCSQLSDRYTFSRQKVDIDKPQGESFILLQRGFMGYVVIPYFRWVTKHIPWFEKYIGIAETHYRRFESLGNIKSLDEIVDHLHLSREPFHRLEDGIFIRR